MRNGWNWKYPLSYMYPAHTQLVAKWSSPSIGDQRATGCPVCIKFSLLARFSLEPITNWLKKPEKEDFSCLSCTKIGESEVWICFDPWIIFLSCKISICLEPGTAPKSGKVYFSQTSEIVFVEYRDLGSSSLMDGNCNFLAVQDSSITDIVCPLVGLSEPTNNQSLGSIKEWP